MFNMPFSEVDSRVAKRWMQIRVGGIFQICPKNQNRSYSSMAAIEFCKLRSFIVFLMFWVAVPISFAQDSKGPKIKSDSLITAAREIIGLQKYCALVTIDSSGRPSVRTMNPFPPEDDMTIWIATNSRSRKANDIRHNPAVCVYYADHSRATGYVSVRGKAYLVDDMKEKLKRKRDYWTQAFPDWKFLVLIKVVPEKIEVINYRRGIIGDRDTWKVPTIDSMPTEPASSSGVGSRLTEQ
jgi:general stress protein 26